MIVDQILSASIILTTPVLLAAVGGLVNRHAGIVNIALEAKMLAGAFVAVIVSSLTGSWLIAVLAAAGSGAFIGLLFSLTITRMRADMIVAGLGLNFLIAGLIGFVLSWAFNSSGTLRMPDVQLLPRMLPDPVAAVPVVGTMLAGLEPITLFAWLSVLVLPFVLSDTRFGLRLRATGNAPRVAHAMGLAPKRMQDISTMIAGAYSGLGGTDSHMGTFSGFSPPS